MASYNITDQDGQLLVKTARKIVTEYIKTGHRPELDKDFKSRFSFESGVFVTLDLQDELRGCIGFPMPQRLYKALFEASIASATQDPRFSAVKSSELDKITFEVTLLSPPVQITAEPQQIPSMIKVGRDGLIVKHGPYSGLLLPQVPVEYGWNEKEFLNYTCQKAGLQDNCWMDKDTKVFSFKGTIFKEIQPNGSIVRKNL